MVIAVVLQKPRIAKDTHHTRACTVQTTVNVYCPTMLWFLTAFLTMLCRILGIAFPAVLDRTLYIFMDPNQGIQNLENQTKNLPRAIRPTIDSAAFHPENQY